MEHLIEAIISGIAGGGLALLVCYAVAVINNWRK
jgi:hypothetical protein